jgi:hypothetical protein
MVEVLLVKDNQIHVVLHFQQIMILVGAAGINGKKPIATINKTILNLSLF